MDAAEATRRASPRSAAPSSAGHPAMALQRMIGNRATLELLRAGQAKLAVGNAVDASELEADALADVVVQRLAGSLERPSPEVGLAGGALSPETEVAIAEARRGGGPLPGPLRTTMERAFAADFSKVRVHTDEHAADLNDAVAAKAFTVGNDIFFRDGLPDTSTRAGQHLLAHEMTHVVQQGGASPRVVHRLVARDGVYSDTEFSEGLPDAREGGTEAASMAAIADKLKRLESGHARLAAVRPENKDQSLTSGDQSWGGKRANLGRVIDQSQDIVDFIGPLLGDAQALLANEQTKAGGFGGRVKGLFKRSSAKRGKSLRLGRLRSLVRQLTLRRAQLERQAAGYRLSLTALKQEDTRHQGEVEQQRDVAMNEARHGQFGMYKGRVNDAKFGAGAMGSVAQVDYKDENGELFKGVFKAEPEQMPEVDGGMRALGASEGTPNFSLRGVAASRINDLLGLKVIPRTELAFHEQFGFGQVMELAKGRSPRTKTKIEIKDASPEKISKIEEALRHGDDQYFSTVVGKQQPTGEVKHFLEETVTFETDWDHPILKRELSNLQLLDALIGNLDRHCENYFVQVDSYGSPIGVLGIDNDLTFARGKNDPHEIAFMQGHMAGLPPAIDKSVAERFCAVSESQMRGAVKGLLASDEIDMLVFRLKATQQRLEEKGPEGYVIPRIDADLEGARKWTDEVKDPKNAKGAYFARERKWQQGIMKESGRLLKPEHARLWQEDRLQQVMKKVALAERGGSGG